MQKKMWRFIPLALKTLSGKPMFGHFNKLDKA